MPRTHTSGYLIPIGGAEDKRMQRYILKRVVELAGGPNARMVIIPAASTLPGELGSMYSQIFTELGAASVEVVDVRDRTQANDGACLRSMDAATGVFLTGGDQVKLVSVLAGTKLSEHMIARFQDGITIAGTSAGASAMSQHMIAFGRSGSRPSQRMVQLSPGLGLIAGVVIDQHFRERDRIGRLMAAVAHNPSILGMGMDEDTAMVIAPDGQCEVIGSGSVTIVDGRELEYTDIHAVKQHGPVAVLGMKVHILTNNYRYHLGVRQPSLPVTG